MLIRHWLDSSFAAKVLGSSSPDDDEVETSISAIASCSVVTLGALNDTSGQSGGHAALPVPPSP